MFLPTKAIRFNAFLDTAALLSFPLSLPRAQRDFEREIKSDCSLYFIKHSKLLSDISKNFIKMQRLSAFMIEQLAIVSLSLATYRHFHPHFEIVSVIILWMLHLSFCFHFRPLFA